MDGRTERNSSAESALDLLTDAAQQAIENAGLVTTDIDGIVTVSSTGLAVPSLDALLMERMPFRRDVHRLPIFGLDVAAVSSVYREPPPCPSPTRVLLALSGRRAVWNHVQGRRSLQEQHHRDRLIRRWRGRGRCTGGYSR